MIDISEGGEIRYRDNYISLFGKFPNFMYYYDYVYFVCTVRDVTNAIFLSILLNFVIDIYEIEYRRNT